MMFYLECESGIAGDMMVAALLDLGADEKKLLDVIKTLPLEGYEIKISRVKKAGIDACDFDVILDDEHANHDHDMEYLHGHIEEDHHEHHHHHDHEHHEQHEHHHHHEHRHLSDVYSIIDSAVMTGHARDLAKKIFRIVAEAEAKAHATSPDEVHFHEVGGVDSIIDIVSCAVCLDDLGIDEIIIPYLAEGQGTVRCAHGILPIPVPAVQNIVEAHKIPLKKIGCTGEFVTPTGAAVAAALRSDKKVPDIYRIIRSGYGAGKRNYERASLVRIYEIESPETGADKIVKLESDIDDSTGERLGYLMDKLYKEGAREVHYSQIQMKKNRPGIELTVICDEDKREGLEKIIFTETTTIGIRRISMERTTLPRRNDFVNTIYGEVKVKKVTLPGGSEKTYPEHDDVVRIATEKDVPVAEVWDEVVRKTDKRE
ncbi:MAG: nickel pincer cofactor biosynthesis protein LarC [Saccharofermentans sp.]|nr:nickel pincer cofactor biosynthesis protein LarC [Saccharofermentans sp.]